GICGIIKRIAGNAVPGLRVDAQDFARKAIDHLRSESADVFLRPDDALVERLLIVGHGIASVVTYVRALTACGKQRPVRTKDERIGSVGVERDGNAGACALADQNCAAGGVYTMKVIR